MRQFYFTQSVTFAKVRGPKLTAQNVANQIIYETNNIEDNANVTNADIIRVQKPQLQVITHSKGSMSNIKLDKTSSKQKVNRNILLKTEQNKYKTIGKFRMMENLESVSIFGSELTKKCSIQYVQSNEMLRIPSVTYILNETMSVKDKDALNLWKKNMIEDYGAGYYDTILKGLLEDGKLFQCCIQNFLVNKKVEVPSRIKSAYCSVEPILSKIQAVHGVVKYVIHPLLRYRGFLDCIVSYRDETCVINWKKSEKQKLSLEETYDAPVQLAAYIGALNASDAYKFTIDRGFIIVAYASGEPATVHEVSNDILQKAWREWLERLKQFYKSRYLRN